MARKLSKPTAPSRQRKTTRKLTADKKARLGKGEQRSTPAAVAASLTTPPDRWNGREPPLYWLAIERLTGAPHRISIDLETHPPLSPKERDQLYDLILDYLSMIGRLGGRFGGWERLPVQRKADWCEYLVVRRGQSWDDRRKDYGTFEEDFPDLARFC